MSWLLLWPIALFAGLCGSSADAAQQVSAFSCDGRTSGYYADVSTGCQVYHMCDGLGRQFSYSCPSKTLFQQRMLICDHWYMVNCSKAEEDYSANLLIGQQGRAFIEDQVHRTPRPDLARPETTDVHIFKAQQITPQNVVGADGSSSEADGDYNPPTHWALEQAASSPASRKRQDSGSAVQGLVKQSYYRTSYGNKAAEAAPSNAANFPSRFKATTPVYPEHLDIDLSKLQDFGATAPDELVKFPSKFQATTPVYPQRVDQDPAKVSEFDVPAVVNFPSHFQATTPVYPTRVNVDPLKLSEFDLPPDDNALPDSVPVNFASKFKATTPVYPETVDVDLSKFAGDEEQPPDLQTRADVTVNFASKFQATTPVYPAHVDLDLSKFQEPLELPANNSLVNFRSAFQATTPVYPESVASTSPVPEDVGLLPPKRNSSANFASSFKATTPVYPRSVAATSPDPSKVGLLAPEADAESINPSLDIQPPSFATTFKRRSDEEEPSLLGNTFSGQQLTEFMLTIKPEQLKDLKQLWHIPDYDFPLDTASRPGYAADAATSTA
ncbi:uncharacterized protein LOC109541526 isoform X1 [Dendroctonus ponderosae]|uniref:uncharacterized protein LOC109541526 isoform X1 n=1 Tax=Dendroctonus ponderosae TaxID=77166 RepID=UPI002035760B|nr:uncharacterized protein LOC109541526 isoform X1 [Dendroctonus ponderosae]